MKKFEREIFERYRVINEARAPRLPKPPTPAQLKIVKFQKTLSVIQERLTQLKLDSPDASLEQVKTLQRNIINILEDVDPNSAKIAQDLANSSESFTAQLLKLNNPTLIVGSKEFKQIVEGAISINDKAQMEVVKNLNSISDVNARDLIGKTISQFDTNREQLAKLKNIKGKSAEILAPLKKLINHLSQYMMFRLSYSMLINGLGLITLAGAGIFSIVVIAPATVVRAFHFVDNRSNNIFSEFGRFVYEIYQDTKPKPKPTPTPTQPSGSTPTPSSSPAPQVPSGSTVPAEPTV